MAKKFNITLDSADISQLLDGLRARAKAWRQTAEFLNTGYVADESFVSEECNASEEATLIASHYAKIISQIGLQVAKQASRSP
jgi:hypothetical protein